MRCILNIPYIRVQLKPYFKDIRFWLVFFFLLRCYHITNPPLEGSNNWRQTTVTMVARNFVEGHANPLYPQLDIGGEKSGITGMEFPVLNYLIYLLSKVFGYTHWYGRIINLVVTSFGLFFFYQLLSKFFTKEHSFFATLLLLLSVWFCYARKIMPDTFSVSLVIIGLYYAHSYLLESKGMLTASLAFLFIVTGTLSKLPAAMLLPVILPLMMHAPAAKRRIMSVLLIAIALIAYWYYFSWVPYLNTRFEFTHFFMGMPFSKGLRQISEHLHLFATRFYHDALGYVGFPLFILGIVLAIRLKQKKLLLLLLLTVPLLLIIILKAGATFYNHDYYVIPFVPVMATFAAFSLVNIGSHKWRYLLLVLLTAETIVTNNIDFYIHEDMAAIQQLEPALNGIGSSSDRIVINSGLVPTPMYFAHRKGWITSNDSLQQPTFLMRLKKEQCKFVVILKKRFGSPIELPLPSAFQNEDFTIYRMDEEGN